MRAGSSSLTDARRREVYCAGYAPDGTRTHGPTVGRPADLEPHLPRQAVIVGAGAVLYREQFPDHAVIEAEPYPEAWALAAIAAAQIADGAAGPADPLYLRRPDAVPPAARKQVTPA